MPDAGRPLDGGYRVALLAEQELVTEHDVLDLWAREGALRADEAQRRVAEVLMVATDARDRLVGVSSIYLHHSEQLHMDLWYFRAFIAAAHRQSHVAVSLATIGRDHLTRRFVSGADTRAAGMLYEVESEILKTYFPWATWFPTQFLFIGENAHGDHVRVFYFPGALAPEPPPI